GSLCCPHAPYAGRVGAARFFLRAPSPTTITRPSRGHHAAITRPSRGHHAAITRPSRGHHAAISSDKPAPTHPRRSSAPDGRRGPPPSPVAQQGVFVHLTAPHA